MTDGVNAVAARRPVPWVALALLGCAAFAVAYCQAPVYYSNQNQYFVHGLANAGVGLLRHDWLARTDDPTPVFSALVTFTVRYLHPWAFYLYYGLLLAAYAAAMFGLFVFLVGDRAASRRWPVFVALLVAVHSALARKCSFLWLGQDYPWFLQAGIAGQYVLGGYLQPSAFGVLLVVAVCLFVRGRVLPAAVCVALSATLHPSYLLPAGLLTLGFLAALLAEGRWRQALGLGVLSLVLVVPVTAHVLIVFGPTSAETFARAQDALVNVRIPHHTRPELFLDTVAVVQIGWMLLALLLSWRTRLFLVLAVPFVVSAVLTLAQVATGSHTLALLFPWRISAVLVPVATTVILSRLAAAPLRALEGRGARLISAGVVAGLVVAGMWITVGREAFHGVAGEQKLLDYVSRTKEPDHVYFLPVRVQKPTRGSLSSDFEPLSAKKQDPRIIQPNLQQFRLYAGAPIYVDFKAIPYKDVDVVAWSRRIRVAQAVQDMFATGWPILQPFALAVLRQEGVTHLILPTWAGEVGWGCEELYADSYYRLYRLPGKSG
jgi:hypothetical protein